MLNTEILATPGYMPATWDYWRWKRLAPFAPHLSPRFWDKQMRRVRRLQKRRLQRLRVRHVPEEQVEAPKAEDLTIGALWGSLEGLCL